MLVCERKHGHCGRRHTGLSVGTPAPVRVQRVCACRCGLECERNCAGAGAWGGRGIALACGAINLDNAALLWRPLDNTSDAAAILNARGVFTALQLS